MGILDEAIKEHLELKRQHGAGDSELQKIEDEAFGASERPGDEGTGPDAAAEAPTEFMAQPDLDEGEATKSEEAPPAEGAAEPEPEAAAASDAPVRGRTEIADLQEPPVETVESAEDEAPAMEHEAISEPAEREPQLAEEGAEPAEPEQPTGPSTEERHAIAEQPTEMYDVEAELGDAEPADEEPEVHALSEEDEEFWDEKRLSDELDQALEAPVELEEPRIEASPIREPEPTAESDPEPESVEEQAEEELPPPARAENDDVLEETPDFLEEAPEDDQLWFEQKPPKDFDFDD